MANVIKNIVTLETTKEQWKDIKENYFTDENFDFEKIIYMPKSLNLEINENIIKSIYHEYYYIYGKLPREPRIFSTKKDAMQQIIENSNYSFENIQEAKKNYVPNELEKELGIQSFEDLGRLYISNIGNYNTSDKVDWCIHNWGTKTNSTNTKILKEEQKANSNVIVVKFSFETLNSYPYRIFEKLSEMIKDTSINVCYADEDIGGYNCGEVEYMDGASTEITLEESLKGFASRIWEDDTQKLTKDEIYKNRVKSVSQYHILNYLKENININEFQIYLVDNDKIRIMDNNEDTLIFTYNEKTKGVEFQEESLLDIDQEQSQHDEFEM